MSYVVLQIERDKYATGYWSFDGNTLIWHHELGGTLAQAAAWCSYLNGGQHPKVYEDWTKK